MIIIIIIIIKIGDWGSGTQCKHSQWGSLPLEANAYNGFKRSRNLCFDTFYHVVTHLLLTKNCLTLSTLKLSKIRIR